MVICYKQAHLQALRSVIMPKNIDTIEFKKSILFGLLTNLRRRFADEMSLSNSLNLYIYAEKLQSETLYAETVS